MEMSLVVSLSPHLLSATCYTLSYEDRNGDSRRLTIVGVYKRAAHAVAALRELRLLIYSGPVAAFNEMGMEVPNGNQIGPLRDPQDPQNRPMGWGYRFVRPNTEIVSTIWIEQGLIFRGAADYGLLEPSENVNWMDFVAESQIDISDIPTNGRTDLNGRSHGFVEEYESDGDAMGNI